MSYTIQAVLVRTGTFDECVTSSTHAIVVPSEQNIEMLLCTDEFLDSFGVAESHPNHEWPQFFYLSVKVAQFCAELSERGVIAYIEAEYFGGVGTQASIAWNKGQVVLGPLGDMKADDQEIGPINSALKLLGVTNTTYDEFETVGLSKHRSLDGWKKHYG